MTDRSDNSLRLAEQLRTTALKNLGRSTESHRSAITGRFVTGRFSQSYPAASTTETVGGSESSTTSRSARTGRIVKKSRKV